MSYISAFSSFSENYLMDVNTGFIYYGLREMVGETGRGGSSAQLNCNIKCHAEHKQIKPVVECVFYWTIFKLKNVIVFWIAQQQ